MTTERPTIDSLLHAARTRLRTADPRRFGGQPPNSREAALLLAHVLGIDEVRLRARGEQTVSERHAAAYDDLVTRRSRGEPVAYLVGTREFYGRPFRVDRRVLVPRPETEHLVEAVLHLDLPPRPRLVDVGTGSGCIAVTLALELVARGKTPHVVAADLSVDALDLARHNARSLGAQVTFTHADLLGGLDLAAVDVLASNPPYVARAAAAGMSPEVTDHEPHLALFADGDGRDVIRRLLDAAAALRPGCHLVLEIGHDQGDWVTGEVSARAGLELVRWIRDLAGHPRTAVVRRVGSRAPAARSPS